MGSLFLSSKGRAAASRGDEMAGSREPPMLSRDHPFRRAAAVASGGVALLIGHLYLGYGIGLGLAGSTTRQQLEALGFVGAILTAVGALEGLALRSWARSAKRVGAAYALACAMYLGLLGRAIADTTGVVGLILAPIAFFAMPAGAALSTFRVQAPAGEQGDPRDPAEKPGAKVVGIVSIALGLVSVGLPVLAPVAVLSSGLGWRYISRAPRPSRYENLAVIGLLLGLIGLSRVALFFLR